MGTWLGLSLCATNKHNIINNELCRCTSYSVQLDCVGNTLRYTYLVGERGLNIVSSVVVSVFTTELQKKKVELASRMRTRAHAHV